MADTITPAMAGLRTALARQGKTARTRKPKAAFAGLSTDQLLTALTDEQRAELAASLTTTGPISAKARRQAEAKEAARAEANARVNTVLASGESIGRTALTAELLANDALPAANIIAILSKTTRDNAGPIDDDAVSSAERANLQALLAASGNAQTASDGTAEDWATVHAELAAERGADSTLVDNMRARFGRGGDS